MDAGLNGARHSRILRHFEMNIEADHVEKNRLYRIDSAVHWRGCDVES